MAFERKNRPGSNERETAAQVRSLIQLVVGALNLRLHA